MIIQMTYGDFFEDGHGKFAQYFVEVNVKDKNIFYEMVKTVEDIYSLENFASEYGYSQLDDLQILQLQNDEFPWEEECQNEDNIYFGIEDNSYYVLTGFLHLIYKFYLLKEFPTLEIKDIEIPSVHSGAGYGCFY